MPPAAMPRAECAAKGRAIAPRLISACRSASVRQQRHHVPTVADYRREARRRERAADAIVALLLVALVLVVAWVLPLPPRTVGDGAALAVRTAMPTPL